MGLRVPFAVNTYKSSLWLICVNYGELQNSDKVFSKSGWVIWLTGRDGPTNDCPGGIARTVRVVHGRGHAYRQVSLDRFDSFGPCWHQLHSTRCYFH